MLWRNTGNPEVTNEDAVAFNSMAKAVKERYEEVADNAMTFEVAGKKYRIKVWRRGGWEIDSPTKGQI